MGSGSPTFPKDFAAMQLINILMKFSTYVKPTINDANRVMPLFSEILKGGVTPNFLGPRSQPRHFSNAGSTADLNVPFPLFLPPPLHAASSASGQTMNKCPSKRPNLLNLFHLISFHFISFHFNSLKEAISA